MNQTEFRALALLTLLMVATAVYWTVFRQTLGEDPATGTLWLEEFEINEVTRIDLIGPGGQHKITLEHRPEGWGVLQRQHYPANVGKIRRLLLSLESARILERKTQDPAQHARLGLENIDQPTATGSQIQLHFEERSLHLRIGNKTDGNTTYVRQTDGQSWLVNQEFDVSLEPRRWLDRTLMDIPMERIRRLRIVHPDGQVIEGERRARDRAELEIVNLPPGRSARNEFVLNRVLSAITALSLEDVITQSEALRYLDKTVQVEYELYNGSTLQVSLFSVNEARYARFTWHSDKDLDEGHRQEGEELARRFKGWAFRIPSFAYDSMGQRWSDLLDEK